MYGCAIIAGARVQEVNGPLNACEGEVDSLSITLLARAHTRWSSAKEGSS